jgi:hypothetical protein
MTTINNTGWKVVERGRVDDDNNNDDNDDNDNDDDEYRGGGIHGRPSPMRPRARDNDNQQGEEQQQQSTRWKVERGRADNDARGMTTTARMLLRMGGGWGGAIDEDRRIVRTKTTRRWDHPRLVDDYDIVHVMDDGATDRTAISDVVIVVIVVVVELY